MRVVASGRAAQPLNGERARGHVVDEGCRKRCEVQGEGSGGVAPDVVRRAE
jgi:hypothetical protein